MMTVKIVKEHQAQAEKPAKKKAVKADVLKAETVSVLTSEEKAAVDELYELNQQLEALSPQMKRAAELKKILSSVAMTKFDPQHQAILVGEKGVVEYGPESRSREIKDMHQLIGALKAKMGGYENLLGVIKINLSDADKYLSDAEKVGLIGEKAEGSRSIKSIHAKNL